MQSTEKLAILTALEKAIKPAKEETRQECYTELMDAFEAEGYEKQTLRVNGDDVGQLILTKKAGHYEITDQDQFNEFALDYGLGTYKHEIRPQMVERVVEIIEGIVGPENLSEFVETKVQLDPAWDKPLDHVDDLVVFENSGMVVPGVKYVPEYRAGMQVRGCDPVKVLPLYFPIGVIDQLLLESANE